MASKIRNILKPIADAIVFSNTWISLAALSLYFSVKLLFELPILGFEAILVFASTFIGYNVLKLKGLDFEGNQSAFISWMRFHKNKVYFLLLLAGIMMIYGLGQVSINHLFVLSFTVLISLIYIGIERFNLRTFWFFKTQLVAFVWTIFILGIALADSWLNLQIVGIFILFSAIFFFILALTIPFEIRDWKSDKLAANMKTIPMVFGLKGTLILSLVHLILSLLIFLLFSPVALVLFPLFIYAAKVIYSLNQDSPEYKYTFILDGLIVLVYPLLLLGVKIITNYELAITN